MKLRLPFQLPFDQRIAGQVFGKCCTGRAEADGRIEDRRSGFHADAYRAQEERRRHPRRDRPPKRVRQGWFIDGNGKLFFAIRRRARHDAAQVRINRAVICGQVIRRAWDHLIPCPSCVPAILERRQRAPRTRGWCRAQCRLLALLKPRCQPSLPTRSLRLLEFCSRRDRRGTPMQNTQENKTTAHSEGPTQTQIDLALLVHDRPARGLQAPVYE